MDSNPKAVAVHSNSVTTIHGDALSENADAYVWEFFQEGTWIVAPGLNNAPDYVACPLLKISDHNNTVKLRRRILMPHSIGYDSYYKLKVKAI